MPLRNSSRTSSTFLAFSQRNFRLYFFGQVVSVSGTWMQTVAQGWLVLTLTGSTVDLGTAIAIQYVPMLLLGWYGGLVADRHEKRRILYITQSISGFCALALALLVSFHHATLLDIYALALALGFTSIFDVPARQAFVQEMVGRDLVANAVSLNSVLMNAARVVGPAIAAAVIALFGVAACFYLNATSFLAVLCALVMMRESEFMPLELIERAPGQIRAGLRYTSSSPLLRTVISAVAIVGIFAFNFTVTLPVFARTTFHDHSSTGYGVLLAAMGVGAVVGGLLTARRSRPTPRLLALLTLLFALSMASAALSPTLLIASLLMMITGGASIAFVATANALVQLGSAPSMRGRVMSLYSIAFLGTTPIGAELMALIISHTSPRIGLLVGAGATLVTSVVIAIVFLVSPPSSAPPPL